MNEMETKIKKFFDDRPALNILKIEEEAGLGQNTLGHFLKGRRGFPMKRIQDLIDVITKYGFTG